MKKLKKIAAGFMFAGTAAFLSAVIAFAPAAQRVVFAEDDAIQTVEGEAFVKAISDTTNKEFGNVKVVFDVTCVILAVLLSFIFFDFTIVGTREGTIISALLTGFVVKLFLKLVKKPLESVLCRRAVQAS